MLAAWRDWIAFFDCALRLAKHPSDCTRHGSGWHLYSNQLWRIFAECIKRRLVPGTTPTSRACARTSASTPSSSPRRGNVVRILIFVSCLSCAFPANRLFPFRLFFQGFPVSELASRCIAAHLKVVRSRDHMVEEIRPLSKRDGAMICV